MKKINNATTKPAPNTKRWNSLIGNKWRDNTPDPEILKDLANRMREWALKDSSLRFDDFLDALNIPVSTYYLWKEETEDLKDAHEFAKRRLASRRERLALYKQVDREIFLRTQHLYDCNWDKDVNQYHKQLKLDPEEARNGETRFIFIHDTITHYHNPDGNSPKYTSSNLTPEAREYLAKKDLTAEIGEPGNLVRCIKDHCAKE